MFFESQQRLYFKLGLGNILEKTQTTVSAVEVKQLLVLLSTSENICFRYRQIGEMWMTHHMRVQSINETSVILRDEKANRLYQVRLNNIMQFDIDERFQVYQPNFHYSVTPSPELD